MSLDGIIMKRVNHKQRRDSQIVVFQKVMIGSIKVFTMYLYSILYMYILTRIIIIFY